MQFYPGDWWKDPGVSALSCEERGIWFQMILLMFEGEQRGRLTLNGKPMPVEALARVIGLETPRLREGLTHIIEYGVASVDADGSIYSRRMIRDEEARAKAKIDGKKGGNPTLIAKQDNPPLNPPVKPKQTPSSSSSSSSSKEPPTPLTPIEKWTELLCETHPGVCDPRFPATFCEDNWHRLREDAERFNVFMGQVFDGLRAHCEYWAVDGNRFAISLDKWLLGGGWKKAPPKVTEKIHRPPDPLGEIPQGPIVLPKRAAPRDPEPFMVADPAIWDGLK